jgi:hypothetical protein
MTPDYLTRAAIRIYEVLGPETHPEIMAMIPPKKETNTVLDWQDAYRRAMEQDAKICNARMIGSKDAAGGTSEGHAVGGQKRAEQLAAEAERWHNRLLSTIIDGQEYSVFDIQQSINADGQGRKSESAIRQGLNLLIGQGLVEISRESAPGGRSPRMYRVVQR